MMTYYQSQVVFLSQKLYPHSDITSHIISAKQFIDQHFTENITLDDIALQALCSKCHFLRLFKNYYGRTPGQYMQELKIRRAKELLKNHNVATVCYALGFSSVPCFTTLFKKATGCTPGNYYKKDWRKSNFE